MEKRIEALLEFMKAYADSLNPGEYGAMGGTLGGDIPETLERCQMEVDYVRVYQPANSVTGGGAAELPQE